MLWQLCAFQLAAASVQWVFRPTAVNRRACNYLLKAMLNCSFRPWLHAIPAAQAIEVPRM